MCLFLVLIIISRSLTPTKIHKQLHQNLLIVCLSAAADLVDFAEYSNNPEIINLFGTNII